jgi:hypothetical protein
MNHKWREVIPPRIYGGDVEPKHALQCQDCGKQLLVTDREIDSLLPYLTCPGSPPEREQPR